MQEKVHYLELIFYKVYADLRSEASRTYVSCLWWLLEPLLYMAGFYFLFAVVLQIRTADFALFLLVGLVVWKWFASGVGHASGSILGNQGLMQQVYLPKIIFPLVVVATDTFKFLLVFMVLLALLLIRGSEPGVEWLALPLIVGVQLLLLSGFAVLAASITPIVPDIRFAIDNLLFLMMCISGVFFGRSDIPEKYRDVFDLNPMASLIQAYRDVLIGAKWPSFSALAAVAAMSAVLLFFACLVVRRYDRSYPRLTVQ